MYLSWDRFQQLLVHADEKFSLRAELIELNKNTINEEGTSIGEYSQNFLQN